MFNNLLAYLVSRLSIGIKLHEHSVNIPYTKFNLKILSLLLEQGCLRSFYVDKNESIKSKIFIKVYLKYFAGQSVLKKIKLISKPSLRVYWNFSTLANNFHRNNFQGFYVVSNKKGIYTSTEILLLSSYLKRGSGEIILKIDF